MRVGIASDHAGFRLKGEMSERLLNAGYEIMDFGADQLLPEDDYPDYVLPLARAVARGQVERGIAICGSGVGVAIAANKVAGTRALAVAIDDSGWARMGVEQEDVNVLCLGARRLSSEAAWEIVREYLTATSMAKPSSCETRPPICTENTD